jgi:hypothetical protein
VAPRNGIDFAAFCKLVERIGACSRQQPQTAKGSDRICCDQRLRHQSNDSIHYVAFSVGWIGGDGRSGIHAKAAGKDRKPSQYPLFFLSQQTIAPVQCGAQRLMPRRSCPAAGSRQSQRMVQTRDNPLEPERIDAGRSKLDG